MEAQCVLCDKLYDLDTDSLIAKKLRNRFGKLYICPKCDKRITKKTKQRKATGKFRLFRDKKENKNTFI